MKSELPSKIELHEVDISAYTLQKIRLQVARFDLVDPVVSGNKWYKLYPFIQSADRLQKKVIVTKGGPYSNHLAATAQFCHLHQLRCIGIVRGEMPRQLSPTLEFCLQKGMQLCFVSRNVFSESFHPNPLNLPEGISENELFFIPEGGYDPLGAMGASRMYDAISTVHPTHICMAVGTATTLAGFVRSSKDQAEIIGFPVLKGLNDIDVRLDHLIGDQFSEKPIIIDGYHFDGYAKKNRILIDFMNHFFSTQQIPTDFVYTGKMMYGVVDLIRKSYFPEGSNIIAVHTGGLQGNASLKEGTLIF